MSPRLSPRKAAAIAWVESRRSLRDRLSMFFVIVLPMILIVVLGMTYGGMSTARVGVVDEDGGPLAGNLVAAIGASGLPLDVRRYTTPDELHDAVERGFVATGLDIRPGYDAALRAGEIATVAFVAQPGSYASAVRTALDQAIADQAALVRAARLASKANGVTFDAALAAARDQAGSIAAIAVPVEAVRSADQNPNGYALGAESQVILFMFLTSMTGAIAIVTTRMLGVSRREFATPTSAGTIVLGETLGRFGFALFQGVFIVVASWALFGVDWFDPLATGAILVLFALVASGAAMLLATFVSNEHQLSALAPALGMSLALLGGTMVPLEVFPPVMQTVALATPHAWAINAFHELLLDGGGVTTILPQLGILLAFAAGLLALAAVRFTRQITGGAVA